MGLKAQLHAENSRTDEPVRRAEYLGAPLRLRSIMIRMCKN